MRERTLLRELRAGETGALEEIVSLYTPYLCAVASGVMGRALPPEDVEEVVSDSFVALWTRREDIQPGKLRPWLAAVTRRKAIDALRAARADTALEDDLLELAAPGDTEGEVLRLELGAIAREAVDSLGEPDGEIFRRHYFLFQKTEEIAGILGMNGATVRTKLARGRERLRAYFTERGYNCANPNL